MPNGIQKQKKPSTLSRHLQLELFDRFGFETMPCSHCGDRGLKCIWIDDSRAPRGSKRCKECVRRGVKCDGSSRPLSSGRSFCLFTDFLVLTFLAGERIIFEDKRLEREEREAEEELLLAQQKMNETLGRLMRLRRQRGMVKQKGIELLKRGFEDMDELEEAERRESDAAVDARVQGAVDVIDWSSVGLNWTEGLTLGPSSASLGIAESSGGS